MINETQTIEEVAANLFYTVGNEGIANIDSFIKGAKWQAERMYTEEEVRHIVSEALQSALVTVDLEQWFKQFKNK